MPHARAPSGPLASSALLALALWGLGCASSGEVIVDVRTDFSPGRDFDAVVVTTPGARTVAPAAITDWLAGVRIGPTPSPTGSQAVAVELQRAGVLVVRRTVRVAVSGTVVVPVWLVRACADVECPTPGGNPLETECSDGRCVAPECVGGGSECPADVCATDGDCTPSDIACAENVCLEGHCVSQPIPGACVMGSWCDPTMGCRDDPFDAGPPDAGPVDAGPPRMDAPAAGCTMPCSDGNPCTYGDACSGASCVGTPVDCTSDTCVDRSCNGTSSCTETIHSGRACEDDGNPCTRDQCGGAGNCRHNDIGDGTDCGGGNVCCAGVCTSSAGCGGCGVTCGAGETCSGGRCTCGGTSGGVGSGAVCGGSDPMCCGGSCVDLDSNPFNCGACGARCGDQYGDCIGGSCNCGSSGRCNGSSTECCRAGAGCPGQYCGAVGTCSPC